MPSATTKIAINDAFPKNRDMDMIFPFLVSRSLLTAFAVSSKRGRKCGAFWAAMAFRLRANSRKSLSIKASVTQAAVCFLPRHASIIRHFTRTIVQIRTVAIEP